MDGGGGGEGGESSSVTPLTSLLPPEVLAKILLELDGASLVSLARSGTAALTTAAQKEVVRRETRPETARAKANAMSGLWARFHLGLGSERNPQGLPAVDEALLCRVNRMIGEEARDQAVPLSDLVEGALRGGPVRVSGSAHRPPPADLIPSLLRQLLCVAKQGEVMGGEGEGSKESREVATDLAGFVFWRMTWVHPFMDGNGRTAHIAALATAILAAGGWEPLVGTAEETGGPPASLARCGKFLDHRRIEVRGKLVQALRQADSAWRGMEECARLAALVAQRSRQPKPGRPWGEVGRVLLQDIWRALAFEVMYNARKK